MITRQQALEMFRSNDLIGLGMAADAVRKNIHPGGLVTYCMESGNESRNPVVMLDFRAQEPLDRVVSALDAISQCVAVMPRSEGTAAEYLKILALARIYLDNVPHIQVSPEAGLKLGQIALRFGANDMGCAEAGSLRATEEDIRRIIRDAGFLPKQRDALFTTYCLN